jgi:hypothetical protein
MTVTVEARVAGLNVGDTVQLAITEVYGSVNDYYREIRGLAVDGYDTRPAYEGSRIVPNLWQLDRPVSETAIIYRYDILVTQDIPDRLARFKPSMDLRRYYSNGLPLFIFPKLPSLDPEIAIGQIDVEFELRPGWAAATSFERRDGTFGSNSLDAMLYSSIALGDYRKYQTQLPNRSQLVVALTGEWAFSDSDLQSALGKS